MKQFFGYLMIILLFGGSICGVVFGIKYAQQQKQIDNLYTEEEVEQKYQQYIDQISEKNVVIDELNGQLTILVTENEQHETTISNLQSSISEKDSQIETLTSEKTTLTGQIETLNSQISELNSQIETLSEDKENNLAQIEELQSEKSALETQVSTLTASVNEKEQTIQTLTADKTELEEEISTLTASISENETTISGLNSQILTLQNEITRLEGLLDAYEDYVNQSVTLTYYVDNVLFDTQVITRGETTSQAKTPEDTDKYSFVKWQIDGEDFDFSTYTFTLNTRIDAVVDYNIYDVTFMYNDEEYYSCDVYGGEYVTGFTAPIIEDISKEYKGIKLSVEDLEYIDLSSYKILEDTTFYVIIEDKYISIQNFDSSDIKTDYSISNYSDFVKLSDLCNSGNSFKNVTIHLVNDVDMSLTSSNDWVPIGLTASTQFNGNFNGHGFSIENFTMTKREEVNVVGLFGYILGDSSNYSVFENFVFENVNIALSTSKSMGAIAGYASRCSFKDISVKGIINQTGSYTSNTSIGGFAGSGNACSFEDCLNYAEVYATAAASGSYKSSARAFISGTAGISYNRCINYGKITAQRPYVFEDVTNVVDCNNYGELVTL